MKLSGQGLRAPSTPSALSVTLGASETKPFSFSAGTS